MRKQVVDLLGLWWGLQNRVVKIQDSIFTTNVGQLEREVISILFVLRICFKNGTKV